MTSDRSVGIQGTGSYLPERILSNHDLERMVETSDEWIFTRTGMRERRIAAPDEASSDLAIRAGQRALDDAGVAPEEIDLVIVATVTPDHYVPPTACLVAHALGASRAGAFDLEAACSGFLAAFCMASSHILSGAVNKVLVIGAECMSRIVDYEDRTSCILFGDGAGAVVLTARAPRGRLVHSFLGADGGGASTICLFGGGSRKPFDQEVLDEKLAFLRIKGNEVFKFAVSKFRELIMRQVQEVGFDLSELGLVIPHQVNSRIIDFALKHLDIGPDRIFMNLDKYGNTAAASVPIALDEARRAGRLAEGRYVSLLAFGAGLTWASILLRW